MSTLRRWLGLSSSKPKPTPDNVVEFVRRQQVLREIAEQKTQQSKRVVEALQANPVEADLISRLEEGHRA